MHKHITIIFLLLFTTGAHAQPINRKNLVQRHNIRVNKIDSLSSLSVGNGRFAFTVDATGMQTFPESYAKGVPLGTQSDWGWHSFPNTDNYKREEALRTYDLEGRKISYVVQIKEPDHAKKAVDYYRVNPHRLQLGNVGLEIIKKDGTLAGPADIKNIDQQLDLWTGIIHSTFSIEGESVEVMTACDDMQEAVSFRIKSNLLNQHRLNVRLRFPYPNGQFKDVGNNWGSDEAHQSVPMALENHGLLIKRKLDSTNYRVSAYWTGRASWKQAGPHYFLVKPEMVKDDSWGLTVNFCQLTKREVNSFALVSSSSIKAWKKFWNSGGAVDFSGSTDPRAHELERRVILSQYLTKIQCSSDYPPQETGLTYNSWYGKPHLEMHWWHAAHYAQWGRPQLLERSLDWYFKVADKARAIAKRQGFDGLRWQKMTDHSGEETPSSVGAFLIWQQPHFIYMAEQLYRQKKDPAVLKKYGKLLFETAEFMASFPTKDPVTQKYNLGKGLIPAQECFDAVSTFNPTYELSYWSWALEVAQQWRTRMGLSRKENWDNIINNLAPLPQLNGVYLAAANTPDCYTKGSKYLTDHPAVLGAYSTIPSANGLDTAVMNRTYDIVLKMWDWNETWGWDYPLIAMTAARLHRPEDAVNALLMPVRTNTYLINGHNFQDDRLTIYLPGNGGLLNAVALMCTGADADKVKNIGFPKDGTWKVRWEGLKKMF
ncbi:MAG TPA: hypothetical protein PLL23_14995 [Chitinophagaceae bacterium]|nr:hypothetical protein [Chitinophagaceae bacterium]